MSCVPELDEYTLTGGDDMRGRLADIDVVVTAALFVLTCGLCHNDVPFKCTK